MFVYTLSDIMWIKTMKFLLILGIIWLIIFTIIIIKEKYK